MDEINKIIGGLVVSFGILYGVYLVVSRLLYWFNNVWGYKYYLVGNTFVTTDNGKNGVHHFNLKIKAKSRNEALSIWHECFKDMVYVKKGDVSCIDWEEMTSY